MKRKVTFFASLGKLKTMQNSAFRLFKVSILFSLKDNILIYDIAEVFKKLKAKM